MATIHYLYHEVFFGGQPAPPLMVPHFEEIATSDGAKTADVLVVHIPSIIAKDGVEPLIQLKQESKPNQIWVMDTLESSVNYPAMNDPSFQALFDIEMSFRRNADVWSTYIPPEFEDEMGVVKINRRPRLCTAMISSKFDNSGRKKYMEELMKVIKIDSYGRFKRNKRIFFDNGIPTKRRIDRKYKFNLAFENARENDYVTEKFFQPLMWGSIPIYLGAPNVEEYAPGDNCFINTDDFPDPIELGRYLQDVDPMIFHEWRKKPLRASFQQQLEHQKVRWNTRLSTVLKAKL